MHELPVVDRAGALALRFFAPAGGYSTFAGRAFIDAFLPPYDRGEVLRRLFQFGLRSTALIATSGASSPVHRRCRSRRTAPALRGLGGVGPTRLT